MKHNIQYMPPNTACERDRELEGYGEDEAGQPKTRRPMENGGKRNQRAVKDDTIIPSSQSREGWHTEDPREVGEVQIVRGKLKPWKT